MGGRDTLLLFVRSTPNPTGLPSAEMPSLGEVALDEVLGESSRWHRVAFVFPQQVCALIEPRPQPGGKGDNGLRKLWCLSRVPPRRREERQQYPPPPPRLCRTRSFPASLASALDSRPLPCVLCAALFAHCPASHGLWRGEGQIPPQNHFFLAWFR